MNVQPETLLQPVQIEERPALLDLEWVVSTPVSPVSAHRRPCVVRARRNWATDHVHVDAVSNWRLDTQAATGNWRRSVRRNWSLTA